MHDGTDLDIPEKLQTCFTGGTSAALHAATFVWPVAQLVVKREQLQKLSAGSKQQTPAFPVAIEQLVAVPPSEGEQLHEDVPLLETSPASQ